MLPALPKALPLRRRPVVITGDYGDTCNNPQTDPRVFDSLLSMSCLPRDPAGAAALTRQPD
jgi:hypothetical protein